MKKSSPSKELLINWLRQALDLELYPGLGWSDREKEIFFVKWVHKSSEQWSGDDLAPFKAWAAHKGKLDGKNPKQLKATFRCALNSKKELEEHHRDRERRYWQFVDPNLAVNEKTPKKKRRNNRVTRPRIDSTMTDDYKPDVKITANNGLFSARISSRNEDEMSRPAKLPAFDLFSNFQPLTPPDNANEITYNPEVKFSKENPKKLRDYSENSRDVKYSPISVSSTSLENSFLENTNEACTVLPPFEIFGSFRILTPPPQKNEAYFIPTEYRPNYTPPPDHSRLTPPQKSYHTSQGSYNHTSTDLWQPNYWSIPAEDKEPKGLSDFFSSDFIGLYKSSTQEPEISSMDFLDMDQYVPVTNTSINVQIYNKNAQSTLINRIPSVQTDNLLLKLDDLCLGDDVDPEMCKQLMQEIETSSSPQFRFHN